MPAEEAVSSGGVADNASSIRVFLIAEGRDYTRFSLERGDEEAVRYVERFTALAREVLEARGGKVIELRGDEALAVCVRFVDRGQLELRGDGEPLRLLQALRDQAD